MKRTLLGLLLLSGVVLANDFERDDANNVVVDNSTNLMWQDDTNASTLSKNWSDAIAFCEENTLAGHNDWRLPNQNELRSIVDDTRANPAIDATFTNVVSNVYWSSSTSASDASIAWIVYFFDGIGGVLGNGKTKTVYVRCVRDN